MWTCGIAGRSHTASPSVGIFYLFNCSAINSLPSLMLLDAEQIERQTLSLNCANSIRSQLIWNCLSQHSSTFGTLSVWKRAGVWFYEQHRVHTLTTTARGKTISYRFKISPTAGAHVGRWCVRYQSVKGIADGFLSRPCRPKRDADSRCLI